MTVKSTTHFSDEVIVNYVKDYMVSVKIEEHNVGKSIDLHEVLNKPKVDFISLNVDGRELQVLSGLLGVFLNNPRIKLLITFNPRLQKATGHTPEELLDSLSASGFEVYMIDEAKRKYYRLDSNPYSLLELMGDSLQVNLLCLNKENSLLVTYFSHMADMTGAEKSLVAQMKDLKEKDVISHVVVPHTGTLTDYMKGNAISYDIVPFHWWGNIRLPTLTQMADSLKSISRYMNELKKINPHIIYTNTLTIPWGALAAYLIHKPHIWHIKEFGVRDHGFKFIVDFEDIKKTIVQLSDFVIFNSKAVEKEFGKTLHSKTLYYNIHIDEKDIKQKLSSLYKQEDTLKLMIVGGVFHSKGQHEAIHAIRELNKRHIPVELVILGQYNEASPYYKDLLNIISTYNLMNVYFHPKVGNPYPLMKQAHILLVCSRMEAFGKVTVEGMLLKKVVIAANTGGTKELITDGKTGYLYNYGNVDDLVEKIMQINENRQLISDVGRRAYREALQSFSHNSYVDDIHQLLLKHKFPHVVSKEGIADYIVQLLKYFTDESSIYINTKKTPIPRITAMTKILNQLRGYN